MYFQTEQIMNMKKFALCNDIGWWDFLLILWKLVSPIPCNHKLIIHVTQNKFHPFLCRLFMMISMSILRSIHNQGGLYTSQRYSLNIKSAATAIYGKQFQITLKSKSTSTLSSIQSFVYKVTNIFTITMWK